MRVWVFVAIAVALLSVVKLHLVRTPSGERQTRVVLQQPFAMPVDSADAYCLRRLDQTIFECGTAFAAQRDAATRLATLPFCDTCARFSEWVSTAGRDRAAVAKRQQDFELLANMGGRKL